jgi:hypothetical protein
VAGILDAIVSALTPDRYESKYQHAPQYPAPQNLGQYLSSTAKGFDPRTPGGAFNLATLLVPGAGKGRPTFRQQEYLDAIRYSSGPQTPGTGAYFHGADPGVIRLATRIGQPFPHSHIPYTTGHGYLTAARNAGEILSSEKVFPPEAGFPANSQIRRMILRILEGNQGG